MFPQVQLSVFTKLNGPLTKQLSVADKKVYSDSSECRMSNGLADRVTVSLDQFPQLLRSLRENQAIATGWVDAEPTNAEIITRDKFASNGYNFPAHVAPHGVYATRTLSSMTQRGESLIMFDHDYDKNSPHQFKDPHQFIAALAKVIPDFDKTTFVRTFSTSSGIYDSVTGECYRPADGFHLYMVIRDGVDLQRFGEVLEKRLWLAGLGYIKVSSKNGSMLKRTIVDTAVFSPERLIFEAGAVILKGNNLIQQLPEPEFVVRDFNYLDTSRLENLSDAEEQAYQQAVRDAQNSDKVVSAKAHIKDQLVNKYIGEAENQGRFISRKMAERMVEGLERHILPPFHPIMLSDGSLVTIAELVSNPFKFDGRTCFDPLRPEKGPDRAKFFGNTDQGRPNPVITSFVEGGRVFRLLDSMRLLAQYTTEEQTDDLKEIADKVVCQSSRYFEEFELRPGVTLVRGEKGVGKTTAVASVVKEMVERTDKSVLAITHRVSLTKALANSFDLACYNEKSVAQSHVLRSQRKLGICYDSLHKIAGQSYDVVVIDELTQLMRHVKSESVRNKFICLNVLRAIVRNAEYVLLMDADLATPFIDMLKDEQIGCLKRNTFFNVVLNNYLPAKEQGRKARVYLTDKERPDEAGWLDALISHAKTEGTFVATNSKAHAYDVANHIAKYLGYEGNPISGGDFITEVSGRRIITVTSDTTADEDVHDFIANLNDRLLDSDILVASPSIGTGVSIDVMEGKPRFARTFGRFTRRAGNTSGDCSQHLARVRECVEYDLLILETNEIDDVDPGTIIDKKIIQRMQLVDRQVTWHNLNFDPVQGRYVFADGSWGEWMGRLTAIENMDRNHFCENLIKRLTDEGYTIENFILGLSQKVADLLREEAKQVKSARKVYETELLCASPLITDEEMMDLEKQVALTMDEKRQLKKRQTADLFGAYDNEELNDLLQLTDQAYLSRRNGMFFGMRGETLFITDLVNRLDPEKQHIEKTFHFIKWNFMWQVADLVGVSIDDEGLPQSNHMTISSDIRDAVYEYLWDNRKDVKIIFNKGIKALHKDKVAKERHRLVGEFLSHLGLRLKRSQRGTGNYYYTVDTKALEQIREDVLRARKHSPLPFYKTLTATPKFLVSYVAQWNARTPEKLPQIHRYVSALQPYQAQILHNFMVRMSQSLTTQDDVNEEIDP